MYRISSANCFISGFTASQSPLLSFESIVGYTLLNGCLFCSTFFSKFSPATAGNIDCNLSFFHLPKDDKKAADIFSITDLNVSIKFLFLLHKTPPICIRRQKNSCDFGCLYRLVLRTDFNPDYLIFSRFYLKNRITTKPTSKSLFFNDFNARRGIATLNSNSMVNDGNYPFRVHKGEQRNRATSSRPTTPFLTAQCLDLITSLS